MMFHILAVNSSVVWPSSLLPGHESKCCKEKGCQPSVMTYFNIKDAFLPLYLLVFTPISFLSSVSLRFLLFIFLISFTFCIFMVISASLCALFPPTIHFAPVLPELSASFALH
ncbi:hypothetical protein XENOCAPTIV_005699 [Xenoophorus captivus]|uniref:Uncharacterized protein n=1 Tax=Xenoophorus captivus TaxID=1517983 RepID=A0ABV0RX29_9TELE